MRTPRPSSRPLRSGPGIGTLIGNGWLRESPRNVLPRAWSDKGRSALRKCMLMHMPPNVAELVAQLPPPPVRPIAVWPAQRAEVKVVPRPRDPRKDARMFPAVSPAALAAAAARRAAPHPPKEAPHVWWEDPVALGMLVLFAPPIGLACVWRSPRYSNDARWAMTVMSALVTCLAGAVVLALVFVR